MKYLFLSLFIIEIILSYIYSKELLEIPLIQKIKLKTDMFEEEIIEKIEKNTLTVEIKIGTPFQKILLDLNSVKEYSYIISEKSFFEDFIPPPEDLIQYKQSKSTTYFEINETNFILSISPAFYAKDNICLGNITIKNFTFVRTTEVSEYIISIDSGYLLILFE